MGKGGGRGKGKGGCQDCCTGMHAFACCLCIMLVGGPILVAIGAGLLAAANKDLRAKAISKVDEAVARWNDPANPNGWQQFSKLAIYAQLQPSDSIINAALCSPLTVRMSVYRAPLDEYSDEWGRYRNVQQLRFMLLGVRYTYFTACRVQVTYLQALPGAGRNATLATLPPVDDRAVAYSIAVDKARGARSCPTRSDTCYGSNYINCKYNCERVFGADFRCAGEFKCTLSSAYFTDVAIKVSYRGLPSWSWSPTNLSAADATYLPDEVAPGPGGGANVMPYGYSRNYAAVNYTGLSIGPLFQLTNIPNGPGADSRPLPQALSLTLRSSADPYLTYMQETKGSGYFGIAKRTLVASGVILVIIGVLGCAAWCVALFYAWRMLCARHRPTARPAGVGGYAWDLANRYGGSYAPAIGVPVQMQGPNGVPTATPLYVGGQYSHHPAPGEPVQGYPYPYPYPPPPGFAHQPGQPGGSVEMGAYPYPPQPQPQPDAYGQPQYGQQPYGQPPYGQPHPYPYAYPPAPGPQPQPAAAGMDSGASAQYSYPYAYPPPYGQQQQPPPAGSQPPPGQAPAPAPPPTHSAAGTPLAAPGMSAAPAAGALPAQGSGAEAAMAAAPAAGAGPSAAPPGDAGGGAYPKV